MGVQNPKKMKILIVSNLPFWSDLLSSYIRSKFKDTQLDTVEDLDLLKGLENLKQFDLAILDINMPDKEALDSARYILNLEEGPEVFLCTPLKNPDLIKDSMKYRIHTYIIEDHELNFLDKSLQEFQDGKKTLGRKTRKEIKQWVTRNESMISTISLSKREREILRMICLEKTSTEISNELFISEHTVLTHRKNLLKKVGCKNTVGLVHYAYQNEII